MARLIFDSGALIAIEDRDPRIAVWLTRALADKGQPPIIPTVVIAEYWRGSQRSARVWQAIKSFTVQPLTMELAREAGLLLGRHPGAITARANKGKSLVVDAIVVATAANVGGTILTADIPDISELAAEYSTVQVERVG